MSDDQSEECSHKNILSVQIFEFKSYKHEALK